MAINSGLLRQLNNFESIQLYYNNLKMLAENVFIFEGFPDYIKLDRINRILVNSGKIAFCVDDVTGRLCALPVKSVNCLDIEDEPMAITAGNNKYTRKLYNVPGKEKQFVLMYDNTNKISLIPLINHYTMRLALANRIQDINIFHQKTPRIFKTTPSQELSLKSMLNNIDNMDETIITYKDIEINETNGVLLPVPYVADKIGEYKREIYNEFLSTIGVNSLTINKKERQIVDEVRAQQGGTTAFRYSRFAPRQEALKELEIAFPTIFQNSSLSVKYYDGVPTTEEEQDETTEEVTDYVL